MKSIAEFHSHDNYVLGILFSPDGSLLVSSGMDKRIMLWSVADWQLSRSFQAHNNSVNGISLSPNGKILASVSTDTTVRLWDFPDANLRYTLQDRRKVVSVVRISPDGGVVASGSYGGRVALWTLIGEPLAAWQTPHKNIAGLVYTPDGRMLATCGLGELICLWDSTSGQETRKFLGHTTAVYGLRFIKGGSQLVSWGYDQVVRFWDLASGENVRSYSYAGGTQASGLRGLYFSADEQLLAVSLDSLVQLRRTQDWELLAELPVGTRVINGIAFSPDGRLLAAGAADRKIRIWQLD